MALKDCIDRALKAGRITARQADMINRLAREAELEERQFLETFIQGAQEQKRQVQLQAIATRKNIDLVKAHPKGVGRGLLALLTRDIEGKAGFSNINYRRNAILADLYSQFAEGMSRFRSKKLGFSQDRQGIKRMVKELFGEESGDTDAKRLAGMLSETFEAARLRFNAAGGNVPRRKDFGLPHSHKAREIAKVDFEEWRDFIVPRLDRRRIFNRFGVPMGQREFDDFLTAIYDQFSLKAKSTSTDIARGVPTRREDARRLTFKNSAAWLEYNERFGEPDIYHNVMNHMEKLTGDTATIEILGPNPDSAFRELYRMAGEAGTPARSMKLIRDVYEVNTGRVNQTESDFLASLGTTVRNLLASSQLGTAFISSFSDLWTNRMTLAMNGMPAVKFIKTIFSQMRPGNEADRIFAVKLGLGAEAWVTRALSASRFQEITGNGLSARISDAVFRATLLSPWTDAGRKAFGMEFTSFIAGNVGKSFNDLPELLRNSFSRHGITEGHWNIIRQASLIERDGAQYLRPQDVLELSRERVRGLAGVFRGAAENIEAEMKLRGQRTGALARRLRTQGTEAERQLGRISEVQDAANKYHELILTEMDFAVPMPDDRIRALATQGQKRGSALGELSRSVALYKQFPITILTTHLYRGARQLDGLQKGKYLAELLVGMTIMGAVSWQARQILKGKDPMDMSDPKFWAFAFTQGGGGGIFGDFIFSDVNRFGKGPISTIAGPVAGLIEDIDKLSRGNLFEVLRGQETRFMAETLRFAKRYLPGGNGWYVRLALERLFWDRLQAAGDPKAHQAFRRIQRRARRDRNQSFWWRPGQPTPTRPPDLGAAVGT